MGLSCTQGKAAPPVTAVAMSSVQPRADILGSNNGFSSSTSMIGLMIAQSLAMKAGSGSEVSKLNLPKPPQHTPSLIDDGGSQVEWVVHELC